MLLFLTCIRFSSIDCNTTLQLIIDMQFTSKKRFIVVLSNFFLVVNAAIHFAFAGTFIDWGSYLQSITQSQQAYKNELPIASYLIIVAIFLILNSFISYTNLLVSARQSATLATFSWTCCWLLVVMNFAAGVLTANQYSRTAQEIGNFSGMPIQFNNQYRCSLADAIITFLLGFPSSMALMHLENYHRAKFLSKAAPRRESELVNAQPNSPQVAGSPYTQEKPQAPVRVEVQENVVIE